MIVAKVRDDLWTLTVDVERAFVGPRVYYLLIVQLQRHSPDPRATVGRPQIHGGAGHFLLLYHLPLNHLRVTHPLLLARVPISTPHRRPYKRRPLLPVGGVR